MRAGSWSLAYLWHADGRTLGPVNTFQLQFLLSILAGWVNRSQQDVIEYLQAENQVLREQLGDRRLLFTDGQRRRLAAKARKIGRKGLFEISILVTPDTLLRWYRRLIAERYDSSQARRAGRPKTATEIQRLILRMARDNPRWGNTRIGGALRNLGHEIGRNTIKRILVENGFDPAPLRKQGMSWETFLKAHWGAICGHGLLQRRGAHADGLGPVLRALPHRPPDSQGCDRRDCPAAGWRMDEADRA